MNMSTETPEACEKLLSALTLDDRQLIESLMDDHPGLTAAKAIEMCADFGGLALSSPETKELLAKSAGS
jgi:hypothetical protein